MRVVRAPIPSAIVPAMWREGSSGRWSVSGTQWYQRWTEPGASVPHPALVTETTAVHDPGAGTLLHDSRWRWPRRSRSLTPDQRRLLWFGATVESLLVAGVILWFQGGRGWGLDAWAYWSVDQVHPYSQTVGSYGAFLYGPPLAQVFGVLGHLPWPVFLVGWTGLLIATYAWLTQRYALVLLGLFPAGHPGAHQRQHPPAARVPPSRSASDIPGPGRSCC